MNSPLSITQFYPGISIVAGNPNEGLGGTQDNGTQLSSASLEWQELPPCGDGGYTALGPGGFPEYVSCSAGAGVWKNSGGGWLWAASGIGSCTTTPAFGCYTGVFIPPLVMDPENSSALYFAAQSGAGYLVYQSTDGAGSWHAISPVIPGDQVLTIDVAPTSSDTVYVGTAGGKVWRTSNATAGASSFWQEVSSGLPGRSITDVAVDASVQTIAYASFSGFTSCSACDGKGHVYETTNGGMSWTNITGNLPDIPVNFLVVDPAIRNALYAATDVGVFATLDGGTTWTPVVSGLPNVAVLGLALDAATRTLWAGTHGRSMWALQLPPLPTAVTSPASLTFPAQGLDTTSAALPVTLTNSGGETLEIDGIVASNGFGETNNCGSSLVPKASCTIQLTFTPTVVGSQTGTLTILDNLRSGSGTVGLSGTGTSPFFTLAPENVKFSPQGLNTTSAPQTLSLSDSSGRGLNTLTVAITGDFTQTNNCGVSVAAEAGCSITVKFAPSAGGSRFGILTVTGMVAGTIDYVKLTASLYGYGTTGFLLPTAALRYVPVTPCRVADTRNAEGPFGGPTLADQTSRDFAIPNSACGIPPTAAAYALNLAVVPSGPLGYLTVWPTGPAPPLVATLNSVDGRVKSSAAIVPAGAGGAISVFASNASDVVLDIVGYFVAATNTPALAFYPLTPCRVVDTRNATGPLGGPPLSQGQFRTFPLQSSTCHIPATAQAYSLNFAAVPKEPLGYLTAWPTGQTQPYVATLNAVTGTVTANAAIVPAGTGGAISVFASNDMDVVIDINGYFAPAGTGGLSLYVLPPCRVFDSRQPTGSPAFSGMLNVNVAGSACGVSAAAQAFVLNATVVPQGGLGYLTLWPVGTPQPLVATLNAVDGAVTNNLAIVPTTNGSISAYASNPTYLVLDIFGYFGP